MQHTQNIYNAVLTAQALSVGYRYKDSQRILLSKVDLTVHAGKVVCLLGPNGAGKSTLIKTLTGIISPLNGSVNVSEQNVHHMEAAVLSRNISIVLTEKPETNNLSVYNLVSLGRYPYTSWLGKLTMHDNAVITKALASTGTEHLQNRNVNELSDGERQKVMIARALAQETPIMILDEPTAFLDLPNKAEIMQLLRQLALEHKKSIILSTHDLDQALEIADELWLLSKEGGLHIGAPEDLILSGIFEQVFNKNTVKFDINSGTFKISHISCVPIYIEGPELLVYWTKRALKRNGFDAIKNTNAAFQVTCENTYSWKCSKDGKTHAFSSIKELVNFLAY